MKLAEGVAGLILAAGMASRMGKFKPLLPVPRASALETAVSRMTCAGVANIMVVTGHNKGRLAKEAKRLGCQPVYNARYKSGMFSSVTEGIRALPPSADAFFLLPADVPLVKTATYKALIDAFCEGCGNPEVVYPTFQGLRGHPPLIGRSLIEPILSWRGEGGLRAFLSNFPHNAAEIPSGDRGTMLDMDTPGDYAKLLAYSEREFYPDPEECEELLRIAGTPQKAVRHSRAVAKSAMLMAMALSGVVKIDCDLLMSACLLHDIAKGEPDHEARGARWLRKWGYGRVASIVASHKDLPEKRAYEAEILYLADKITDGTEVLPLGARLERMKSRFPPGSEELRGATRRIAAAAEIQRRVEDASGMALEKIIGGEHIGER
jgi:CTP:molybdopterin cytidylyltransferase MocA